MVITKFKLITVKAIDNLFEPSNVAYDELPFRVDLLQVPKYVLKNMYEFCIYKPNCDAFMNISVNKTGYFFYKLEVKIYCLFTFIVFKNKIC